MHFGATLRLLRTDAGWSLRALAQRIGVSSAYLSRVENGHDPAPTPDRLVAIARALGVPAPVLLDLASQVGPAVSGYLERVPAASALFLDIARRNLSTAQVARVKAFVDQEFPDKTPAQGVRLRDLLTPSRVVLGLRCADLEDVVAVAVTRLAPAVGIAAPALVGRILDREREASSLLGGGVAAPHASIPGARTAAALVTLATPIDLAAPDGQPVGVALVVTATRGRAHLEVLARIARLAAYGVVDDLRAADSPGRVLGMIERLESLW